MSLVAVGEIFRQQLTRQQIDLYAKLTGDYNSIHFGENAIVHGGLLIGVISARVWAQFGNGTKARGIDRLRFIKPIAPNETFTIFLGKPTPIPGRERVGEQVVKVTVTKMCGDHEKIVAEGEVIIILPT